MSVFNSNPILELPVPITHYMFDFMNPGDVITYARTHRESKHGMRTLINDLRKPTQTGFYLLLTKEYSEIVMATEKSPTAYTWRFGDRKFLETIRNCTSEADTFGNNKEDKVSCTLQMFKHIGEVYPAPILQLIIDCEIFSFKNDAMRFAKVIVKLREVRELFITYGFQRKDFGAVEYILSNLKIGETLVVKGGNGINIANRPQLSSIPRTCISVAKSTTPEQILAVATGECRIEIPQVTVQFWNRILHLWLSSDTCTFSRLVIAARSLIDPHNASFVVNLLDGLHHVNPDGEAVNIFPRGLSASANYTILNMLRTVGLTICRRDSAVITIFNENVNGFATLSLRAEYPGLPTIYEQLPSRRVFLDQLLNKKQLNEQKFDKYYHNWRNSYIAITSELLREHGPKMDLHDVRLERSWSKYVMMKNINDCRKTAFDGFWYDAEQDFSLMEKGSERVVYGHLCPNNNYRLAPAPPPPTFSFLKWIPPIFRCKSIQH